MQHKTGNRDTNAGNSNQELGAPFEAAGLNTAINSSGLRVVPSQFSFPEYPVSVALIREQYAGKKTDGGQ